MKIITVAVAFIFLQLASAESKEEELAWHHRDDGTAFASDEQLRGSSNEANHDNAVEKEDAKRKNSKFCRRITDNQARNIILRRGSLRRLGKSVQLKKVGGKLLWQLRRKGTVTILRRYRSLPKDFCHEIGNVEQYTLVSQHSSLAYVTKGVVCGTPTCQIKLGSFQLSIGVCVLKKTKVQVDVFHACGSRPILKTIEFGCACQCQKYPIFYG